MGNYKLYKEYYKKYMKEYYKNKKNKKKHAEIISKYGKTRKGKATYKRARKKIEKKFPGYFKKYAKCLRDSCRERGICIQCYKRKVRKGHMVCSKCTKGMKLLRGNLIKKGICTYCHKRKAKKFGKLCTKCIEKTRKYNRKLRMKKEGKK